MSTGSAGAGGGSAGKTAKGAKGKGAVPASLTSAPPLKKQRIIRGAQPFEELMTQALWTPMVVASFQSQPDGTVRLSLRTDLRRCRDEICHEREFSVASPSLSLTTHVPPPPTTTKRKAPAAPPPSAHQTGAEGSTIAQRRKPLPAASSFASACKELFGFDSLKLGQEIGLPVVLDPAQQQRHLLFILPTGGGKSLIFQL